MIKKKLLVVAMAMVGISPTFAATSNAQIARATLNNGLRVVVVRNALAPVVTTQVNYLVGSDEAPPNAPGTAHALENMMFRGSPDLSKDQLAAIAANMGGAFNAQTMQGSTQYFFVTPSQDLDVALHLESQRMRGINASDAEWGKERGAIKEEVARDLSSPDFKFYTEMLGEMFAGTPYAHSPLGTKESFDQTTAASIKQFHDQWYAHNNAVMVIVGDVDPDATLAKVKAEFGDIPQKTLPTRPVFHFDLVKAKTVSLPTDSPYGSVYLAYRLPGAQSKDYATAVVMAGALGSQRAELFGMGMEGKALFGGFAMNPMPEAGIGLAVGIFPAGGDAKPVLKRMQDILMEAAQKGIDPALVDAAKRKALADMETSKNSVAGLANAWSSALVVSGVESPDALARAIRAVTPTQVNAMAKATFDPAQAITAVLTPEKSGHPSQAKGMMGAESFANAPDKAVALPPWAEQAFAKLELPQSMLHPASYTLPNGLKLIVQPESVSDVVQVIGRVQTNADMQAAPGQDGVDAVLNGLFAFGTERLNRLQFQQALDMISAREAAGKTFSLSVPSTHFADGMALLAENQLHPALPEQAFSLIQRQQAGLWAGVIQSPAFLDELGLYKALLPAHDPQLRYATPESVMGLRYEQLKAYYHQTFRPDMTTLVVVGNVAPEQVKAVVEKTFGQWRAQAEKPDADYPAVPGNKPADLHTPDASTVQDSVRMAQMIDVTYNDPARYALTLGNQVLGGGFYASRLYRDLRDTTGLVYTVDSTFDLDKRRGRYTVSFGADPSKVREAHAIVLRDIQQMQSAPASTSDLQRAKGLLIRRASLGESSFDSIGKQLLTYAERGQPLDETMVAAKHYLELSASEVQQAYAKHIRLDGFITAVKGPTPAQ
ncbi:M16 family metallopeptidase [Dyella japonica]|uniref:Zinc protease n=1 Tax=Dyella japonica TaxID=231455 RepID=A0ABV2K240_9GAMM